MTADSVFWIASMTKAITTAAACSWSSRAKLSLDEPIGKLAARSRRHHRCLEGFGADGGPKCARHKRARCAISWTHTARLRLRHVERRQGQYLEKTGTPGIITCQNPR